MKVIRGLHNLDPSLTGCVATIGNFDGMHRGHGRVLEVLHTQATALGAPSTVIIFEPQPQEYFSDHPPPRLFRWRDKARLLGRTGVDCLVTLRFDARLAALTAEEFVRTVLVEGLKLRHLIVGDDFRFGKGRSGDFQFLRDYGANHGFDVTSAPSFHIDGRRVSSTWVRECLAAGDLATARKLLGRFYGISGRVVPGNAVGRDVGYRTANVELHRRQVPMRGIFAARIAGLQEAPLPGVAYVGKRPLVNGTRDILEAHIFDYDDDCYGRYITVEFVEKLRDDRRFESAAQLRAQIDKDVMQAKAALTRPSAQDEALL